MNWEPFTIPLLITCLVLLILVWTYPNRTAREVIEHDERMAGPLVTLAEEVVRIFEDQISASPQLEEILSVTIMDARVSLEKADKQAKIRRKYLAKRYVTAHQFSTYLREIREAMK